MEKDALITRWSSFNFRININSPITEIYQAWATPEGLEKWFLREAEFTDPSGKKKSGKSWVTKGDHYAWRWHGYPDEVREEGRVLEANGVNVFSFSFGMNYPVMIRIYPESDESIVDLTESGMPTDEQTRLDRYLGDSKGWIFYLTNLKSVLEGGLDLRNKKLDLKNVITA